MHEQTLSKREETFTRYLDETNINAMHTMTKQPPKGADESQVAYEQRLVRYSSVSPAQYVIELRAGRAKELGIKTSQKIAVDGPALKAALR